MGEFSFDTSGVVYVLVTGCVTERPRVWPDLSPFVQGYVEALFAACWDPVFQKPVLRSGPADFRGIGFSDLDPSALALILRDCERFRSVSRPPYDKDTAICGRSFWLRRQDGVWNHPELYPPLQPYLSDEGKVCLRECA